MYNAQSVDPWHNGKIISNIYIEKKTLTYRIYIYI